MNWITRLILRMYRESHAQAAEANVRHATQATLRASRAENIRVLTELAAEPGTKVCLGTTSWGQNVEVPLVEMVKACGLTTGGMGSGKTMFALPLIHKILQQFPHDGSLAFGVLDAKGELFDRALYLIGCRLQQLEGEAQQELLRRLVIIDFANREAINSYNILSRWKNTEPDYFITSRLETLCDLLPSGEKLSARGGNLFKYVLALLCEFGLPLTYLDRVLGSEEFRAKLLAKSRNEELKFYFRKHFVAEGRQTLAALRARVDSLFASEGVKLALAGSTAPDFLSYQNEGKFVLVNCAGPTITRGVRLLLQGLVLSDIRQAIFARPNNPPVTYLWIADEAQNFFLTRQQQENMADILTMARSFGSFFYFLCQNLTTAVPDARILETLHTNIRWSLSLRSTPHDANFLRDALPVTGLLERPRTNPYVARTCYNLEEERRMLHAGIANLPDREGYLWLKARTSKAIRIRTPRIVLPEAAALRTFVDATRDNPALGGRVSREGYARIAQSRDETWMREAPSARVAESDLDKRFSGTDIGLAQDLPSTQARRTKPQEESE